MSWTDKLMAELKRDWKRTSLLVVLTVVGGVLLIRQLAGPPAAAKATRPARPAGAAAGAGAAPREARAGDVTVLANPTTGAKAAVPAGNKVFRFTADVNAMTSPRRDPFRADLAAFPPDPASQGGGDLKVSGGGPGPTTEQQRAAREAIIKADAAKLQLQSIVLHDSPQAMIGGDLYRVGAQVGPFKIAKITRSSVTLERDGFEVMLRME